MHNDDSRSCGLYKQGAAPLRRGCFADFSSHCLLERQNLSGKVDSAFCKAF